MAVPSLLDQARFTVPNSVHRRLANLEPLRSVAPDFPMERMILVLKMAPEARSSMEKLLRDQQDPASPSYHQWLTPEDFGTRFGPNQAQRDAATLWLLQQGFTVHGTAKSGLAITFSGTAATVSRAFNTAIMEYNVDGAVHHGNATSITLPGGLAEFVSGVASLNDLRPHPGPKLVRSHPLTKGPLTKGPLTQAVDGNGDTYIGPGDFAAIYNLNPLFNASTPITGAGVSIAVVAQADIVASDFGAFSSAFNLGKYNGTLVTTYTGADPGVDFPGDQVEAELDTQWAHAAAPGASIQLVIGPSSSVTSGIDLSAMYIVDNNLAPVMTDSWGGCEADMGTTYTSFYEQLWAQAAGQGISVFVSTGDSGAAMCTTDSLTATGGKAVNGLASTPYNTAVGGTMITGSGSAYWNTALTKATYQTTALGYVPEAAWSESFTVDGIVGWGAGGGGVSTLYAKPSWQNALNVPADGMRDLPDVSLNASNGVSPSAVILNGQLNWYGGTSVASPCMAGIAALIVQKYGRQGNLNPTLYRLGSTQFAGSGPAIFHDITSGSNSVPGQAGFLTGTGYDLATGLGSLDATALVNNWVAGSNPITISGVFPAAPLTVANGSKVNFSAVVSDSAATAGSLTYSWDFGDGSQNASTLSASNQYWTTGSQNQTFMAHLTVTDQNSNVQTSSAVQVNVTPSAVNAGVIMPVVDGAVLPGVPILFNGTATTANAGAGITSYLWQVVNGQTGSVVATGSGKSFTYSFASANYAWEVVLTATDSTGAQGQTVRYLYATTAGMDLNSDGVVDVRDLLVLASYYGNAQATPTNLNGLFAWADYNADGLVNDVDLNLWISNFTPVAP